MDASETITTSDGFTLSVRRQRVQNPVAEVILVHGFAEHSGRYGPLIEYLASNSFSVTAYDQRGHGESSGLPGHVDRFDDYQADLHLMVSRVKEQSAGKVFIIGHSMGGLVTLKYLSGRRPAVSGAVVSAPMLGFAVHVPPLRAFIARLGSRLAPRRRLPNEINPAALSRDPEVGRAYAADPLIFKVVSTRWFAEALKTMDEVQSSAPGIKTPLLMLQGMSDRLTSAKATVRFAEAAGGTDTQLVTYPGYYHELFNEPEKLELYAKVTGWLNRHL